MEVQRRNGGSQGAKAISEGVKESSSHRRLWRWDCPCCPKARTTTPSLPTQGAYPTLSLWPEKAALCPGAGLRLSYQS